MRLVAVVIRNCAYRLDYWCREIRSPSVVECLSTDFLKEFSGRTGTSYGLREVEKTLEEMGFKKRKKMTVKSLLCSVQTGFLWFDDSNRLSSIDRIAHF